MAQSREEDRVAATDADPISDHEQQALIEYEVAVARGEKFPAVDPEEVLNRFGFGDAAQ